jgi:hypothetical protein
MAVERKLVCAPLVYRGYTITVRQMQPDLLGYVDSDELPHFYRTPGAVYSAGRRYIDEKIKVKEGKQK